MMPIPFISTDIVLNDLRIGYDNSTPVPSDSRYNVFFRTSLTTVSATRVGIRIPVLEAASYPAFTSFTIGTPANTDFIINGGSNDDPSINLLSGSPWPDGNERNNWTMGMEGNDIVIWTTNSASKAMLSVGVDYWFCFRLKAPSGFFWGEITPTLGPVGKSISNFRSWGYLQTTFSNGSWIVDIQDYNA
jgi:hypothetical protein